MALNLASAGSSSIVISKNVSNFQFYQADQTAGSTSGHTLQFQAQNSTGTTSNGGSLFLYSGNGTANGGDLVLSTGTGSTASHYGNIVLQTGGNNRMVIPPTSGITLNDTAGSLGLTIIPSTSTTVIRSPSALMLSGDAEVYLTAYGNNRFVGDSTRGYFEGNSYTSLEIGDVGSAAGLGFYGQTPQAKPTITGSKTTGAALISLLTMLAGIGLLTDGTSA